MKRFIHICIIAALAAGTVSCARETAVNGPQEFPTRGFMEVELSTDGDADNQQEIHSVRLIIFNEASTVPELEFNGTIPLDNPDGVATELSVLIRTKVNLDKMVCVLVNEPAELTETIREISTPEELRDLSYGFAQILNENPWTLKETGMPMSGVVRGVEVWSENNPEFRASKVDMVIERVVARVDFLLRVLDEGAKTGYTSGVTTVKLENTWTDGALVRGNRENGTWRNTEHPEKNFGQLYGVSGPEVFPSVPSKWKEWAAASTRTLTYDAAEPKNNIVPVCSFYTAERDCSTDDLRLKLVVDKVKRGEDLAFGENTFVLKDFVDEKGKDAVLDYIERNHVYRIVGTVKKDQPILFGEITVSGWRDREDVDFPIN